MDIMEITSDEDFDEPKKTNMDLKKRKLVSKENVLKPSISSYFFDLFCICFILKVPIVEGLIEISSDDNIVKTEKVKSLRKRKPTMKKGSRKSDETQNVEQPNRILRKRKLPTKQDLQIINAVKKEMEMSSDEDLIENNNKKANKILGKRKLSDKNNVQKNAVKKEKLKIKMEMSSDEDLIETKKANRISGKRNLSTKNNLQINKSIKKEKLEIKMEMSSDEDLDETIKVNKTLGKRKLPTGNNLQTKIKKEKLNLKKEIVTDEDEDLTKDKKEKISRNKIASENIDFEPSTSTTKQLKALKPGENADNTEVVWKEHELLSEKLNIQEPIARNLEKLFSEGMSIPFIARYRREVTGHMTPEDLREVKNTLEEISHLKQKISNTISLLNKTGKINEDLNKTIKSVKSFEELEVIYAPFKPEGGRTLAERAKALGLEKAALDLLENKSVNLNKYVKESTKGLESLENVKKGAMHIISQKIASDTGTLLLLRNLLKESYFSIETKKIKTKNTSSSSKLKDVKNAENEFKFQNYFDFKSTTKTIKPHQILAINRGENLKMLSVKIVIPDYIFNKFQKFCYDKWINNSCDENRKFFLMESIKDCYDRLVQPLLVRKIRSDLKSQAEKASCDVFSKNLKHLLLAAPIKGHPILGIDPGFKHGCKIGVISATGAVLDHQVIYPHTSAYKVPAEVQLKNLLQTYNCSIIALGDRTASKETEAWLTELIKKNYFYPIDVKYTLVNEDGASVYSCSPEARKEFGDLDINVISAISLARRVQDPMAELVKVDPKHLGVGMYQHDLKNKMIEEALNEVVSECVSFVGVDLNTASQALLRRVAGLTEKRASEIVKYRKANGPFISRSDLNKVSGIGPRSFQQCAGFLRVGPIDVSSLDDFYKNPKATKLDQTYIHPESYDVTKKLLKLIKVNISDIGQPDFINKIKSCKTNVSNYEIVLGVGKETLHLIIDALSKPLNYDLRAEVSKPVHFSQGLQNIDDLEVGSKVTGRVKNVTHFGCFVDIGLYKDALIHSSKLGQFDLQIGDVVDGVVCNLDKENYRINLQPLTKH